MKLDLVGVFIALALFATVIIGGVTVVSWLL